LTSAQPIRLAYLVSQYPAVNHTFILREIRALRQLGADVTVISIRAPDRPWDKLSEVEQAEARQTFTVLKAGFAAIAGAHVLTFFRHPLRYLGGLLYAMRLAKADLHVLFSNLFYFAEAIVAGHHMVSRGLMHVHSHFSSTVALLLVRVFPVTFSVTIHGPDEFNCSAAFYLPEKVASARFICAISDYAASQLMKDSVPEHWNKLEVARLGIDSAVFRPRPHRQNPERIELVCVGRLAPVKGQAVLIAAVARLIREGRRIHLRLVGEGVSRPHLERLIAQRGLKDHVTLEGSCNQDRVLEFYRQTDLFVLASFAEGVPVVLMEAMGMEIPCLATWITGVPELIRHGVDGWLVRPGNEQELADAIAKLLDDPELRQRLGAAGRVRVQDQYELEINVERLARIYEERLSRKDS
jgi:colanic acid/amylovoran biosynthesis glycosyltransferase